MVDRACRPTPATDGADREAYPAATYGRLADVKRRYDPSNLFRMNQNIKPSGASAGR